MGACSSKPKTLEYEGSMEPTEKASKEISTVATDIASEKSAAQKLELQKDAVSAAVEGDTKKEKKESKTEDLPGPEAVIRTLEKEEAGSKDEEETRAKSKEEKESCLQAGDGGVTSEVKDDEVISRSFAPAPANETCVVKEASEGLIQADTASDEVSVEKEAEVIGSEKEDIELISDKVAKAMASCEATNEASVESSDVIVSTPSDKAGEDTVETIENITTSSSVEEPIASETTKEIPVESIPHQAEKIASGCISTETTNVEKDVESLADQTAKTAFDVESIKEAAATTPSDEKQSEPSSTVETVKDAVAESSDVVTATPSDEKQCEPASVETVKDAVAELSDVVATVVPEEMPNESIEEAAVESECINNEIIKDNEPSDVVVDSTPADVPIENVVTLLSDETKNISDIVTKDAEDSNNDTTAALSDVPEAVEEKHIPADKDGESVYVDKSIVESSEVLITATADEPCLVSDDKAVDVPSVQSDVLVKLVEIPSNIPQDVEYVTSTETEISKVATENVIEAVEEKDVAAASCQVETTSDTSEVILSSESRTEADKNEDKGVGTSSVIPSDDVHDPEAKFEEKISTDNASLESQEKVGSEANGSVTEHSQSIDTVLQNTTKDQTIDTEVCEEHSQSEHPTSTVTVGEATQEKPIENVEDGPKQIIEPRVDENSAKLTGLPEEPSTNGVKKHLNKLSSSLSDVFEDALDEPLKVVEPVILESESPEDLKPEIKTSSEQPVSIKTDHVEGVPCEEPSK